MDNIELAKEFPEIIYATDRIGSNGIHALDYQNYDEDVKYIRADIALPKPEGYTEEDMTNAFYNRIWCNANPRMGFTQWLQQYKKDKAK
jgi:hypothetical protein